MMFPDVSPSAAGGEYPAGARLRSLARSQEDSLYRRILSQPIEFGTLAQAHIPLSAECRRLCDIMMAALPEGCRPFAEAWLKAVENSGTLKIFPERLSFQEYEFEIGGERFTACTSRGLDRAVRAQVIKAALSYVPRPNSGARLDLLELQDCALCANVAQALDSACNPSVPCNALMDLGDFLWLVNKFPYNPGDSMILPKAHDDMTGRVEAVCEGYPRKRYPCEPGRTRGAVLSPEYLQTVMAVCDRFAQEAQHNHVMDGMNQPRHEHFKLKPEASPGCRYGHLYRAEAGQGAAVDVYRPPRTPFDALALASADKEGLARAAADLLERMERAHEVCTLSYFKGHWFILPRRKRAVGEVPAGTGSTIACHMIEDAEESPGHLDEVRRVAALRGEFDWSRYLAACRMSGGLEQKGINTVLAPELERARERVLAEYRPVDYRGGLPWGGGANLRTLPGVSRQVIEVYERTLREGRQDRRRDPGHGEFVTCMTHTVAEMNGLSFADCEAADLAAVMHDTGYAFLENVAARFDRICTDKLSPDPEVRRRAAEDDAAIRREHQAASVSYMQTVLRGYPRLEEISRIVGDHDRRLDAPTLVAQCLWDGDYIARVWLPCAAAMWERTPDLRGDIDRTIQLIEKHVRFAQPQGFHTPAGYAVARLEFVNTTRSLLEGRGERLPEALRREYAPEIDRMLRSNAG